MSSRGMTMCCFSELVYGVPADREALDVYGSSSPRRNVTEPLTQVTA